MKLYNCERIIRNKFEHLFHSCYIILNKKNY